MLEQIMEWFQNGGAALTTGLTALGGGLVALKSVVSTFSSLKSALPETVTTAVDNKLADLENKVEQVKTSSDAFKLQETIINCKAKLQSSVASDEIKAEYFSLMTKAQAELKEVYGVVVEIPASVNGEVI